MARTWGDTDYDEAYGLYISDSDEIFVTGIFYGSSVEFAPVDAPCFNDSEILPGFGCGDAFAIKYIPGGCW
jgi:hypothetical protein